MASEQVCFEYENMEKIVEKLNMIMIRVKQMEMSANNKAELLGDLGGVMYDIEVGGHILEKSLGDRD